MDIDKFRRIHLAMAESLDAWRIIPRALAAGYCYLLYKVVVWYMDLAPYILEKCSSPTVTDCIVQAPTNQHVAVVTAVVGIAAAVFGLYVGTGKNWNGFTSWKKKPEQDVENSKGSE